MDKVYCPYPHAGEMKLITEDRGTCVKYNYACSCGARSPSCTTEEGAYAAAMQRYQEPNRVLTLEELDKADSERSLYFETRELWSGGEVFESSVECAHETFCDGDESNDARKEYGVTVRCWLRRPTDAEREEVKWG